MTESELMTTAEYARVVADPLPDEPRLMVAEAIRSRWPQRAELIDLMIAERAEERRGEGRTPRARELFRKTEQDVRKLHATVLSMLPRDLKPTTYGVLRGFLQTLGISAAAFNEHGAALVALLAFSLEGSPRTSSAWPKIRPWESSPTLGCVARDWETTVCWGSLPPDT
jgi:hypothetical protein